MGVRCFVLVRCIRDAGLRVGREQRTRIVRPLGYSLRLTQLDTQTVGTSTGIQAGEQQHHDDDPGQVAFVGLQQVLDQAVGQCRNGAEQGNAEKNQPAVKRTEGARALTH